MTLHELSKEYEPWAKAHKAESTLHRESSKLKLLLAVFGDRHLAEISMRDIERYMENRLQKVKPRTVNLELALLRHMLTKAVRWGYLIENPAQKVESFKEPPGRVRYLNADEYERLLIACNLIPGLFEIVYTALQTGMRKGELMNLAWNDINLDRREITLNQTKNNRPRYIPISDALYPILQRLAENRRGSLVFTKPDRTPYGDPLVRFKKACAWAGIENFRFHDLRHTFASYLAMSGVQLATIQTLMGHKTPAMTSRYAHLSKPHLLEAVNKLPQSTNPQTRTQTDTLGWS